MIAADLERAIRSRRFRPGHNIPSERELSEQYGATRQTVRAAVDRLHTAELVVRDRLGTYVLCEETESVGGDDGEDPPAPSDGFPGLLLQTDVLHSTGLLTGGAPDGTAARVGVDGDDAATADHAPFLYRHWAYAHDGRIVQSSISSFHHQLVDQAPPLAEAVEEVRGDGARPSARPRGVDPDLRELLGWLSLRFPGAQRTDHVRALPQPVARAAECEPRELHPTAHVHIERNFKDADGRVLLRTVFHVFDDRAQLTFQPGTPVPASAPKPATAKATATTATAAPSFGSGSDGSRDGGSDRALRISERDRAWLEAWLLPSIPDRGLANRARIVLTCAETSVKQAATRLNLSEELVRAWLGRYVAGGVDALRQPVRVARAS